MTHQPKQNDTKPKVLPGVELLDKAEKKVKEVCRQ